MLQQQAGGEKMPDYRYPQVNAKAINVEHGIALVRSALDDHKSRAEQAHDRREAEDLRFLSERTEQALARCDELLASGSEDTIWAVLWHFRISQK